MSNFFQNLGTGQNLLNMKSMLGFANNNTQEGNDIEANNAITDAEKKSQEYDFSGINTTNEEYSDETKKIQENLNKEGYSLGPSGVDGIRGKWTRAAEKQYEEDMAKKLLEQQSIQDKNKLLTEEGRGGVVQDDEGYSVPVYAAPKWNNRFS